MLEPLQGSFRLGEAACVAGLEMYPKHFSVEVEPSRPGKDGEPSVSAVFRNFWVKDGFAEPPAHLATSWDAFSSSCKRNASRRMLGHREIQNGKAGKYVWQTYEEVFDKVLNIGYAMRTSGILPKAKCGIYGKNCPQWIIAMEACCSQNITCVPIYDSVGENAVQFILLHAEISIVFIQDDKISNLLNAVQNKSTQVKVVVSFTSVTSQQEEEFKRKGILAYSWDMFLNLGKQNPTSLSAPIPQDIVTIMYTSGTLGEPKGVILTHESVIFCIAGIDLVFEKVEDKMTEDDCYLSFLPLAHIFDRVIEEFFFYRGASVGYYQGNPELIKEDLLELRPTLFAGVPRVFERIYSEGMKRLRESSGITKLLFNSLYYYKLAWMKRGFKHTQASPLADTILFNRIKARLGGKVRLILSGAAPLSSTVEEFLRVTTCSHVLQGYGLTETCAVTAVSLPDDISMVGTVGAISAVTELRLESVPEMGYDALATPPRGELCFRGKSLFSGYYKRDDLTREAFKDGWFHTGDIGEMLPNGAIRIIDRKKNIFKLSQGEYIAVEKLESIYQQCSFVDMIWIYGSSFKPYLVAVIVPNQGEIERLGRQNGLGSDVKQLLTNPKLKDVVLQEFRTTAENHNLAGYERISAVHFDPRLFDVERDLLTPTFKKKRLQLLKYYEEHIDQMYSSLETK